MKALAIKRVLGEETKKKEIAVCGVRYALHVTHNNEAAITDLSDYEKIYSIQSMDFYQGIAEDDYVSRNQNGFALEGRMSRQQTYRSQRYRKTVDQRQADACFIGDLQLLEDLILSS